MLHSDGRVMNQAAVMISNVLIGFQRLISMKLRAGTKLRSICPESIATQWKSILTRAGLSLKVPGRLTSRLNIELNDPLGGFCELSLCQAQSIKRRLAQNTRTEFYNCGCRNAQNRNLRK